MNTFKILAHIFIDNMHIYEYVQMKFLLKTPTHMQVKHIQYMYGHSRAYLQKYTRENCSVLQLRFNKAVRNALQICEYIP